MTDKRLVGVSLTKHFDDGSTEAWSKVSAPAIGAILAAGLAVSPKGSGGGKYRYLNADECPVHGPWRAVPSGISKSTGRPYPAFYACDQPQGEERCLNRPTNEWIETHPIEPSQAPPPEPTGTPTTTAADFDDLPF